MKLREITGGGVNADKVRGKEPMPAAKKRGKHPFKGRLVGEDFRDEMTPGQKDMDQKVMSYAEKMWNKDTLKKYGKTLDEFDEIRKKLDGKVVKIDGEEAELEFEMDAAGFIGVFDNNSGEEVNPFTLKFMKNNPINNEAQLNEIAPAVYAAVMWILNYSARRAAWPVLRWVIKRHMGKIAVGATAAYYIDQGWDWVVSVIGEKYAQMLIDNKFEIGMAVALILGAVALQKFFMKKGDELVSKYQENINETTSAGGIAAVAMPMGTMQRRGVAPKRKAKKKK